MKNLNHLIQNACEDYFASLDHEPTLLDIEEVCTFDMSSVIWKALRLASESRNNTGIDPIINGIKQSKAKGYLIQIAQSLLGKPVGSVINSIKNISKTARTYDFNFYYGTNEGLFETLQHSEGDEVKIVGVTIEKIKK